MKRTAYIVFTISLSLLFGNCVSSPPLNTTPKAETAQIAFRANPSVGDNWVCTITPEGIVERIPTPINESQSQQNTAEPITAGAYHDFIFTFQPIASGIAEIVFTNYYRGSNPTAIKTYHAIVNGQGKLTITFIDERKIED
jgi:hypothetical protein